MRYISLIFALFCLSSCKKVAIPSVQKTMDQVVDRLYGTLTYPQMDTLTHAGVLTFLKEGEKEALATQYWKFGVNVPVKVSLMRHKKQEVLPFWLESAGFKKTELTVANANYEYEVWQKDFPKGVVQLGVNGFDKHRPVYFVAVAPQEAAQNVEISPIFPEKQHMTLMEVGAFTYHDWDGLVLTTVPKELQGHTLLATVRGRAREAHVLGAFRETQSVSSTNPDQILLTYNQDPANSVAISWRTNTSSDKGQVIFWEEGSLDKKVMGVKAKAWQDRMLRNDRYVHRFTANLENLKSGKTYRYQIGDRGSEYTFKVPDTTDKFSFVWFGDTHNDEKWGKMLQMANKKHPSTEFYMIAGDLVNTGLHRDDWDKFFAYSGGVFSEKPMMAIPGNHDSQDGLGAGLYQYTLPYPSNGPKGLEPGLTYAFNYKNALYLMIDAASFSNDDQTAWIVEQLSASNATWKFLSVHFPPFNEVEEYPDLVEKWVPLFDKYKLDFVFSGHFHYYLRSYPMRDGKVGEKGTIYMTSVGTSAAREAKSHQPFVQKRLEKGNFYQMVDIDGNKLHMKVYDNEGVEVDFFEIVK